MGWIRPVTAAVLAALLAGCASQARAGADTDAIGVLFVGNSLTSSNDLPAMVAELAATTGRRVTYRTVSFPGYSLEDHWNQGLARTAIAGGDWDVVVMQQGPSSLPESQAHLRLWATRFSDAARAAGTTPGLLTVWPESDRRSALPTVIASYRRAATAARASLYPAGEAWRVAWSCNRRLGLYGPDGLHPSRLGTYAAALVVYGRLFKAPLLVRALTVDGVRPGPARLLRAAAAVALGRRVQPGQRCG